MDDSLKSFIQSEIRKSLEVKQRLHDDAHIVAQIGQVARLLAEALKAGNKILLAGNGGSAADAQHIAAELVGRFNLERQAMPALALTTDTSILTAVANDVNFDAVFARQIEALGQAGDVFVAISTSGDSQNILTAIEMCRRKDIKVMGLTGESGGQMASACDECICVPSGHTANIQENHILVGHILCAILEKSLFGGN